MPTVTIAGAGTTSTLNYSSSDSAPYANILAVSLNTGIESGSLTALNYSSGTVAPSAPDGVVIFTTTPTTTVAIPTTDVAVVIAGGATSITGGGTGITVVGGSSGVSYTDITPSGNTIDYIAVGDGANLISTANTGTGNYQINAGAGNDTISLFGNGLVNAGSGENTISVSGGSSFIYSEGADNITLNGVGSDTVDIGAGQATINPGSSNVTIVEPSNSSKPVFLAQGTGSDTVLAGAGTIFAGTGGNSILVADARAGGTVTDLYGAESGDHLYATGDGTVVLAAGAGSETLSGAGGTLNGSAFAASTAADTFVVGSGNDVIIGGSGSDTVDFAGARADYALTTESDGTLLVTGIGGGFSAVDTLTSVETLAFADQTLAVPCFAKGTRILTISGGVCNEVPVEDLSLGDRLVTATGGPPQVIRWIGTRQVDCHRHRDPQSVLPVRVAAHAFGLGCPHRDVILSPDHAVFAEGVLIPVKQLVNGTTVRQMPSRSVVYYHVELERHDVVLADGLPCESYLDTGDRAAFSGGTVTDLHPAWGMAVSDVTLIIDALSVAPLRVEGPEVEAVRARLHKIAGVFAETA